MRVTGCEFFDFGLRISDFKQLVGLIWVAGIIVDGVDSAGSVD